MINVLFLCVVRSRWSCDYDHIQQWWTVAEIERARSMCKYYQCIYVRNQLIIIYFPYLVPFFTPPLSLQPDCSLHLYLRYSQLVAPMYNMSSATEPLTVESAPGIIIAHG